ncbi:MAG: ABC transporter permease [Erysipelothrix sp.]|uniref:ABC transporter permease n=1 Tax=Anaerorhabdus sp. TaxID=1872524 RepID=UPI002FC9BE31
MSIWDNILLALQSLRVNKMRALLTMLGIIIGISAVIAIVTLGNSMTSSITDSMSSFGISNVNVSLVEKNSSNSSNSTSIRMFTKTSYSDEDLISTDMINEYRSAFKDQLKAISLAEGGSQSKITKNQNTATVNMIGVNTDYSIANNIEMITGRFINQEDLDSNRQTCIISNEFAKDIFGSSANAVGQTIDVSINGFTKTLTIAGVYKYDSNGQVMSSSSITTDCYLPITTLKQFSNLQDGYSSFTIVANNEVDSTTFLNQTTSFFQSYYTLNDSYTVSASNMESMLESMTEMLSTITLAIAAIAAISLLVGGIGVMNIMLVSITERTREIGTRKALGATNTNIRLQFIVEAMVICLIGGLMGVCIGIALGSFGSSLLGYPAKTSISAIVISVLFSMSIGVFFGYYPANKAAKMDPIDALRYE